MTERIETSESLPPQTTAVRGAGYRTYVMVVVLLIMAVTHIDRMALGVALQSIKAELHLSDTELGLLTGIAYAFFYSILGVPLAWVADRGWRAQIIAVATGAWAVAVAAIGLAHSFVQLALLRVGAAVGEAGNTPATHSLVAAYYPRSERPRAFSVFLLSGPLGLFLGYLVAGRLNDAVGWRLMFVLLAAPGAVLALLAALTLKDAVGLSGETGHAAARPAVAMVDYRRSLELFKANRTFRSIAMSMSVSYFFGYGVLQWKPTFFIRSFGLTSTQVGAWFALIYGAAGLVGTLAGGLISAKFAREDEARQLKGITVAYIAAGLVSPLIYLAPNYQLALVFLAVNTLFIALANGPLFATIQTVVPAAQRATAVAIIFLMANLIGMGLGPLVAGMLSDLLRSSVGRQSMRYALLVLSPGYCWCAWFFWRASRSIGGDVVDAQAAGDRLGESRI